MSKHTEGLWENPSGGMIGKTIDDDGGVASHRSCVRR